MEEQKVVLTSDQALSMLPDAENIHTYRQGGMALIGADWTREHLESKIHESRCEIGGPACVSMNHGLVVMTENDSPLFVECREGLDYESFSPSHPPA